MKNKKLIIILMVCVGILAAVLAVFSFLIMKKSAQKEQKAKEAVEEALQEKSEEGSDNTEEIMTPEPTVETGEGELTNQVVFEETDDQVFVTVQTANLRGEPSTDAEILATAPMSRLFVRTGVSAEWSRIKEGGKIYYVSNEVISTERPEAAGDGTVLPETEGTAASSAGKTVIIDPGHQGSGDSTQEPIGPGASSTKARVTSGTSGCVSGLDEYQLNLTVSLKLRDELVNRGYTVYMTRETHDVNISNKERAEFATEHGGDILVRIHANGSENSSVSGALTMAPSEGNPFLSSDLISKSQLLSQNIIDAYTASTGFASQGVYITDEMSGINWSTMPVTIVEMGYMSNPSDDAAMADPVMQTKMVSGIADGIGEYFS
ncbi:N-acetylmuramoyl-L-alanine amidase [Ruminococcus gauvreauii]|uniref:N-acetylmuramoyl-L-alanine amidase n=1 Tax=Ruminococcus gauvreauii TaxID=438033 RepID=A0ABY5VKD1_9FIRM|nr:N-acetylmuramoyl-L-alanine amidase [Ruminococcus gauvreauii]UWP61060.1 N-acetylmuramoyl-L-alanine amidase [Ruminococcus gauvreauii]